MDLHTRVLTMPLSILARLRGLGHLQRGVKQNDRRTELGRGWGQTPGSELTGPQQSVVLTGLHPSPLLVIMEVKHAFLSAPTQRASKRKGNQS